MSKKAILKFQCSKCDEIHDDQWSAEECCQPEIYDVFACPACDKVHDSEDEALACCPDEGHTDDYHVDPAVLESFGQQRLAL